MKGHTGKAFNPAIHGARGLFAAMVFIFHVVNSGLPTFALLQGSAFESYFLHSLKFGVELFFGISGFVIVGALARSPSPQSFLWDRATRIYPLLWMTLLAITLVSLVTGRWLPGATDWLLNFLAPPPFFPIAQVNPAAWSLGYEMTFYALCALAWTLRAHAVRGWLPLAGLAGAILIAFFPRAILIPAGILLAAGFLAKPAFRRLAGRPGLALLLFLLGWRAIELATTGDMMKLTPAQGSMWLLVLPALLIVGAAGALALQGIAEQRGRLGAMLTAPVPQWLGTISYSFYLWHPVVMGATKALLQRLGVFAAAGEASQLVFAIATLPVSLIVAHYSQVWIEARLTRALRRAGPREGDGKAPLTATVGDQR